jgi:hypothetical protein
VLPVHTIGAAVDPGEPPGVHLAGLVGLLYNGNFFGSTPTVNVYNCGDPWIGCPISFTFTPSSHTYTGQRRDCWH